MVDIQKENILEDLEERLLKYKTVGEFLIDIKKEFGREDKESAKVAELEKVEQGNNTMGEFVQEFRRTAKGSRYEEKPLVEEFKQGMNRAIQRKLMEAEQQQGTVEQQYERAIVLDKNWRESKREEERLRERQEVLALRQEVPRQWMIRPQIQPRRQEISQQ